MNEKLQPQISELNDENLNKVSGGENLNPAYTNPDISAEYNASEMEMFVLCSYCGGLLNGVSVKVSEGTTHKYEITCPHCKKVHLS